MNTDARILAATAIFATAFVDGPAIAADNTLPPELVACTKEREVIRRLSCFDSVMAELLATPAEDPPAIAAAPAAPVPSQESEPAPHQKEPAEVAVATVEESLTSMSPDPASQSAAPAPTPEPAPAVAAVGESPMSTAPDPAPQSAAPAPTTAPAPAPAEEEPANAPASEPVNVPSAPAPAAHAAAVRQTSAVFEPEEFTATVRDIRKRPYGELVILLSNGQIWEQKHVDRRFRLEIGEEVTISKGSVSGYRLSGRSNNSIQVERRN